MNKVIFLDRDGTINVDYGYVHEISKLVLMPNAIDGLKKMNEMGYKLIIITNQSGIGRKMYSMDEYNKFTNYFIDTLSSFGIKISGIYYCPHTEEDNCNCRKPKLGLYYSAIKEFNIDLENSFAIGDKERDLSICEKTKVKGILLESTSKRYLSAKDLLDAAAQIKQYTKE